MTRRKVSEPNQRLKIITVRFSEGELNEVKEYLIRNKIVGISPIIRTAVLEKVRHDQEKRRSGNGNTGE